MSDARKADASDWSFIENGSLIDAKPFSLHRALIELRARVEALEATQHAHADVSRLSDAEREQFYAELAKPATEWLPSTALLHGGSPAASTEARPAGLVEMVAEAMQPGTFDWSAYEPEARAAIRAVAAWFTTITPHGSEAWRMASEVLEQEANRG